MICKLTDSNDCTCGPTQWGPGVTHETDGSGELCGPGWLHYYSDPLIAVFHNPIHSDFDLSTAHLWEVAAAGEMKYDNGMKAGCTRLTTLRRIETPPVTIAQRVAYGILCARGVCHDAAWGKWAERWLDGTDRSARAAAEAWEAAGAAAWAAAWEIDLITIAKKAMEIK